jgi:dihydrofolate reductase
VSTAVLCMSMSLDGFVAGPNEGPGNGLGDGGHRLHEWGLPNADADTKTVSGRWNGVNGKALDELMATGTVVAGRGTFELADGWGGDHHDGVPIFILARRGSWRTSERPRTHVETTRTKGAGRWTSQPPSKRYAGYSRWSASGP